MLCKLNGHNVHTPRPPPTAGGMTTTFVNGLLSIASCWFVRVKGVCVPLSGLLLPRCTVQFTYLGVLNMRAIVSCRQRAGVVPSRIRDSRSVIGQTAWFHRRMARVSQSLLCSGRGVLWDVDARDRCKIAYILVNRGNEQPPFPSSWMVFQATMVPEINILVVGSTKLLVRYSSTRHTKDW